jgi:hypothetical protein
VEVIYEDSDWGDKYLVWEGTLPALIASRRIPSFLIFGALP